MVIALQHQISLLEVFDQPLVVSDQGLVIRKSRSGNNFGLVAELR